MGSPAKRTGKMTQGHVIGFGHHALSIKEQIVMGGKSKAGCSNAKALPLRSFYLPPQTPLKDPNEKKASKTPTVIKTPAQKMIMK